MARDIDTIRIEEYNKLRELLPNVFVTTSPVSGNALNSFIWSIANENAELIRSLEDFKDNINVLTAASGIGAWEDLLGITQRTDLLLPTRRSRVFSRTSGGPTTLAVLKDIIGKYIDSDFFQIYEYHTLNDPTSAFRYKIQITRIPGDAYDITSMQNDVLRIQPAHCGDYVEVENRWEAIADTFTVAASAEATPLNVFVIGSSLIGGPDVIGLN